MKIIPKNVIRQWYQMEYDHTSVGSVYQSVPPSLQRFYALLEDHEESVKTVLDLGCGDGRSLIELAKMGFEVTGIDVVGKKTALRRATAEGVSVRFIEGDIAEFAFEREQYDAIISSEVFHLLPRSAVESVLDRMIQATKDKGFVYVSILSDLKRHFLKTSEEFQYEDQPNFSVEESTELLRRKFMNWNIIELDTIRDGQDWPLKLGNYPIEPYHWSGEYVYLMSQKMSNKYCRPSEDRV